MLFANKSTSRFSHETSAVGYSKPAPGPLIVNRYKTSAGCRKETPLGGVDDGKGVTALDYLIYDFVVNWTS